MRVQPSRGFILRAVLPFLKYYRECWCESSGL